MNVNFLPVLERILILVRRFFSRKLPVYFFSILLLNLITSPLVYASNAAFTRGQSYALGLLGLVIFSLFIYLFVVIFQPEKF